MNIDQLHYFAVIVETGTISGAARRLHMSQPPLSLQIRNLETEYGVRLFERGSRQIRLTEAGRHLYSYARKILELRDLAEHDLARVREGKQGTVRIGVISSGSCRAFFNGIAAFQSISPDVRFSIYDGNTYEILEELEREKIELAVIRTPFPDRGLDKIPLQEDHMVIAGKEEFLRGLPGGPLHLSDLEGTPLVCYRRWEKIIREKLRNSSFSLDFYCVNDDARTSLQWARAGFGAALLPASALNAAPDLPFRALADEDLASTLYLVRPAGRILSDGAEALFRTFRVPRKSS
ncbi:DNA-binding transcriptional regulator, LysR family [[Clostridium] aminophilum]|uniref:DNA-binding transcriptional regulator, LysR family n=1 Tax=[Clostridium] aminophilum TaxID=1526 RepID=A0A1I0IH11_9FIRM|nr:LysR family transcriptional regulator [[Clostridium] aminophilum]SET96357.1 DNA-binding transcriptional regulator, LysR family [[Clostridium] aminophilum]